MKYAKKIQLGIEFPRIKKSSTILGKHGMRNGDSKHRIVRRYVHRKSVELLRDLLPEKIKPHLVIVSYSEIHFLGPHIHTDDGCVINFYQKVGGEITSFWDGNIERDDSWSTDNGDGYILVNPHKVDLVEHFKAQDGDVYLLDTKQPHSVSMDNDDKLSDWQYLTGDRDARLVVQAYISLPFSDVARELQNKLMLVETDSKM